MPLVDWDGQTPWDAYYGAFGTDGYIAARTYGGAHMPGTLFAGVEPHVDDKLAAAYAALIPTVTDRVLIAGSALGWSIDALVALGYPNVVGLDNSTYMDTHPSRSSAKPFRKADMATGASIRNTVRAAFGELGFTGNNRDPEWIITESVLESFTDAEIETILDGCEALLDGTDVSRCVHVVTPGPFGAGVPFNDKTIAEWQVIRPAHTWIDYDDIAKAVSS